MPVVRVEALWPSMDGPNMLGQIVAFFSSLSKLYDNKSQFNFNLLQTSSLLSQAHSKNMAQLAGGKSNRNNRVDEKVIHCYICNKTGHFKDKCQSPCKWCDKPGHKNRDCDEILTEEDQDSVPNQETDKKKTN